MANMLPPPPAPDTANPSREEAAWWAAPLGGIVTALIIGAIILGLALWATAGRAGTVVHYVCLPGDTAVVRDGFGQRTPQCVTADGATVYWPDRVRVPR